MTRIGIIGGGNIAVALAQNIDSHDSLSLSWWRARSQREHAASASVPLRTGTPDDAELARTDLVVEAAHPTVVAEWGERILRTSNMMVVSVGALADAALYERLRATATEYGTSLIVPSGALVGLDGVLAQQWDSAVITMTKAPQHLEPSPVGIDAVTTLFDGSVAELAQQYPRNVNAMVAFAIASCGLDDTVARLVCDPDATHGSIRMELAQRTGARLTVEKRQPMVGVSGSEMMQSIIDSVHRVSSPTHPGVVFA
ncbi:aspartate dehydrogenase domain-containing protein [Microbacterium sp. YY-01]|uniref:aspartate dehydrogenase domain-containing protein n=1 Tax=Microbacterium sp. YY-01 TaxID=3421634 RepID=UPI003D16F3A7